MEKTKVWFLRNCWLLFSCSVMPNSLQSHGLYSPFNSPGQNTGVGRLSLLQGISPTQGLNPGLPQCKQILYQLSHKGSPGILEWAAYPFFSRSSWPRNWTGVPDAKSWLIGKDPDAGKDWGQEEKGMTEDEVVGWHHWLDGHGIGWTLGVGDRQGGLACCGLWGHRFGHDWAIELNSCIAGRFFTNWPMREAYLFGVAESDTTEQLNWTELLHCRQILYQLTYEGSLSLGVYIQTHIHWFNDAIQPSHPVTSFCCFQSCPASRSFPMSWLFASGGQSIGASA